VCESGVDAGGAGRRARGPVVLVAFDDTAGNGNGRGVVMVGLLFVIPTSRTTQREVEADEDLRVDEHAGTGAGDKPCRHVPDRRRVNDDVLAIDSPTLGDLPNPSCAEDRDDSAREAGGGRHRKQMLEAVGATRNFVPGLLEELAARGLRERLRRARLAARSPARRPAGDVVRR
jgi:hypothetical protein